MPKYEVTLEYRLPMLKRIIIEADEDTDVLTEANEKVREEFQKDIIQLKKQPVILRDGKDDHWELGDTEVEAIDVEELDK